ncbi:MAG: hypothetical protein WEA24_14215 [Gemmatimonadota bacterium]
MIMWQRTGLLNLVLLGMAAVCTAGAVVDRTGRVVERVTLPYGEAITGFGASSVYTIRLDEYDLQWLRRHARREE